MNYPRETIKQAGYTYLYYYEPYKAHILLNDATLEQEVWSASKNFAGYALIYKNTVLEFCRTVSIMEGLPAF